MSGPFGFSMTVISGQWFSGELAVAASTFLSTSWLDIHLISAEGNVRKEFIKALEVFENRENFYYHSRPEYYVECLTKPDSAPSTTDFFWLAMDREGEALAKKIFEESGVSPDKRVHRSINKLNLIEQTISPPPQAPVPLQVWDNSKFKLSSLSADYRRLKPKESRHSFISHRAPLTADENLYMDWFETLYEILIPWQDNIKQIQSDLS